jgi:hypothetical protein
VIERHVEFFFCGFAAAENLKKRVAKAGKSSKKKRFLYIKKHQKKTSDVFVLFKIEN